MKIRIFWGELADASAKKKVLVSTRARYPGYSFSRNDLLSVSPQLLVDSPFSLRAAR